MLRICVNLMEKLIVKGEGYDLRKCRIMFRNRIEGEQTEKNAVIFINFELV